MSESIIYDSKLKLLNDFIFCVSEMRRFQQQWFKNHNKDDLIGSKQYEERVDELLFAINVFKEEK